MYLERDPGAAARGYSLTAQMHYAHGKLFIIGGYSETEYFKKAESACYSIDLEEFKTTRAVSTFL